MVWVDAVAVTADEEDSVVAQWADEVDPEAEEVTEEEEAALTGWEAEITEEIGRTDSTSYFRQAAASLYIVYFSKRAQTSTLPGLIRIL